MEIMMLLDGDALNQLREEFRSRPTKHPDGFSVDEFVDLMLEKLPVFKDRTSFTKDLCELFAQIDVNGDGTMEWEEFTSYCVEAGIVATRRIMAPLKHKFVEHTNYVDRTSRGSCIWNVMYARELSRLFVFEAEATRVKMYTPKLELLGEINMPQNEVKPMVNNGIYIPEHHLLVVASSDFSLTFWDASDRYKLAGKGFSRTSQIGLCWGGGMLYTWGSNTTIHMWNIKKFVIVKRFTKHTDIVLSMCAIPEHNIVLSGGMDKKIHMWELGTSNWKGQLLGHTRGVKQIIHIPELDLALSSGFECDAYGWDLGNKRQVMRLRGHRFPLVGIQPLRRFGAFEPRAVTGDREGNFKVWDISKSHTGLAVCLQTFTTSSHLSKFTPRAFCTLAPTGNMVAAGMKLHLFASRPVIAGEVVSTAALWNPVTRLFVTAADTSITLWEASGKKVQDFHGLTNTQITAMTVDDRKRKLLLGTQSGAITVYNFVNGAVMKESNVGHQSDVTSFQYVDIDKIVVSASWDRCIHVYDENDPDSLVLLRKVENAHGADVTCVTVSRNMSLIASGGADSTLHVWDYLNLKLVTAIKGHHTEITALHFVDPYPLLISADCAGFIMFWGMRGGDIHLVNQCLHVLRHQTEADPAVASSTFMTNPEEKVMVPVSSLATEMDDESQRLMLFVADEAGFASCYDLSTVLEKVGLVRVPEHKKACARMNYNPRIRVTRYGPGPAPGARKSSVRSARSRRSVALQQRRGTSTSTGAASTTRKAAPGVGGGSSRPQHRSSVSVSVVGSVAGGGAAAGGGKDEEGKEATTGAGGDVAVRAAGPGTAGDGGGGGGSGGGGTGDGRQGRSRPGSGSSVGRHRGRVGGGGVKDKQRGSGGGCGTGTDDNGGDGGGGDGGGGGGGGGDGGGGVDVLDPIDARSCRSLPSVSPRSEVSRVSARGRHRNSSVTGSASMASSVAPPVRFGVVLPRVARQARKLKTIPLLASWRAHSDAITSITASNDPPSLVTCSYDKSVRTWSFQGEALGVLTLGKAQRRAMRRGDIPAVPWRFRPDAASREAARLRAAHEVLATIEEEKQRELERVAENEERAAQQQAWISEQVRLGRVKPDEDAPPMASTGGGGGGGGGAISFAVGAGGATGMRRREKKSRRERDAERRRSRTSSVTRSMAGGGASASAASAAMGGSASVAGSVTAGGDNENQVALRWSVLGQLATEEEESGDDDIVVEDDMSDPGTAAESESALDANIANLTLAAALATGQRKPLESKYASLTKERDRHNFQHTGACMQDVDTRPSEFIRSQLAQELPSLSMSRSQPSLGAWQGETKSHRRTASTLESRRPGKGMRLSTNSAPASRAASPHGTQDGRGRLQLADLDMSSVDMQGDSFVESGPATSATPPRSHPLFPAASSRQRPHSTPLRSMSHLPVHERLYGARVMHKKERRLERSFSRRDNMRAAALSEQQQAQGKALMATINRILTAKFGSKGNVLASLGDSSANLFGADPARNARGSPAFTSISAIRSLQVPSGSRSLTSLGFSLTPKGANRMKRGDRLLTVAERAMRKLEDALREDERPPPTARRRSQLSHHSRSSSRHSLASAASAGSQAGRAAMFGSYSEKEVRELKELFDAFDVDGSGTIDASEFGASSAWRASNLPEIASSLFDSLDKDGSGELTLDELVKVVFPYASDREVAEMVAFAHRKDTSRKETAPPPMTREQEEEYKAIFRMFDTKNTGALSQEELYAQLSPNWGEVLSRQDLMNMCREVGLKPTDPITSPDFVRLLHERA